MKKSGTPAGVLLFFITLRQINLLTVSDMRRFLLLAILAVSLPALAQNSGVPFNGIITDLLGNPVKRCRVYVNTPDYYSMSKKDGRFGLTDVHEDDILTLYYKKTVYYVPVNGRKSLRIRLGDRIVESATEDQTLTDMGYNFVSQREISSASNVLTGDMLHSEGYTTLFEAIQGRIPGVLVNVTGLGIEGSVNMRGVSSISAGSAPIFTVDDVEIEINALHSICIQDIERIEVIKEAGIYGARGANGVIKITTKGTRKS